MVGVGCPDLYTPTCKCLSVSLFLFPSPPPPLFHHHRRHHGTANSGVCAEPAPPSSGLLCNTSTRRACSRCEERRAPSGGRFWSQRSATTFTSPARVGHPIALHNGDATELFRDGENVIPTIIVGNREHSHLRQEIFWDRLYDRYRVLRRGSRVQLHVDRYNFSFGAV